MFLGGDFLPGKAKENTQEIVESTIQAGTTPKNQLRLGDGFSELKHAEIKPKPASAFPIDSAMLKEIAHLKIIPSKKSKTIRIQDEYGTKNVTLVEDAILRRITLKYYGNRSEYVVRLPTEASDGNKTIIIRPGTHVLFCRPRGIGRNKIQDVAQRLIKHAQLAKQVPLSRATSPR